MYAEASECGYMQYGNNNPQTKGLDFHGWETRYCWRHRLEQIMKPCLRATEQQNIRALFLPLECYGTALRGAPLRRGEQTFRASAMSSLCEVLRSKSLVRQQLQIRTQSNAPNPALNLPILLSRRELPLLRWDLSLTYRPRRLR